MQAKAQCISQATRGTFASQKWAITGQMLKYRVIYKIIIRSLITRDYNDTLRTYGTAPVTDGYPNNEFYFIVFILRIFLKPLKIQRRTLLRHISKKLRLAIIRGYTK